MHSGARKRAGHDAATVGIKASNGRESLPVGRPDFKPGEGRYRFCVGSTPTLFRQTKSNDAQ